MAPERVLVSALEKTLYAKDASALDPSEPEVVCLTTSASEVQAAVRIATAHGCAITPRGAGTGLAGGTVPLQRAVVIATTKMNRVISVDPVNRSAWVEPGVLNLDLSRSRAAYESERETARTDRCGSRRAISAVGRR